MASNSKYSFLLLLLVLLQNAPVTPNTLEEDPASEGNDTGLRKQRYVPGALERFPRKKMLEDFPQDTHRHPPDYSPPGEDLPVASSHTHALFVDSASSPGMVSDYPSRKSYGRAEEDHNDHNDRQDEGWDKEDYGAGHYNQGKSAGWLPAHHYGGGGGWHGWKPAPVIHYLDGWGSGWKSGPGWGNLALTLKHHGWGHDLWARMCDMLGLHQLSALSILKVLASLLFWIPLAILIALLVVYLIDPSLICRPPVPFFREIHSSANDTLHFAQNVFGSDECVRRMSCEIAHSQLLRSLKLTRSLGRPLDSTEDLDGGCGKFPCKIFDHLFSKS